MSTFIGATEAARLLGVTKPTLYAYVSRGLVDRRTAVDGRTSLYSRDQIEQLASSRGRRRAPAERPTIDVQIGSSITTLHDDRLAYRGHDVAELVPTTTFESVAELLWAGACPPAPVHWGLERAGLDRCRAATADVADPLRRLSIAAIVLGGDAPSGEAGPAAARRLLSLAPSLLGGPQRGEIARRVAGIWHRQPSDQLVDAIRCALVLLADHELATSTLAVRVAASVRADPCAAFAAGLSTVSGPLHGAAGSIAAGLIVDARERGTRTAVAERLDRGRRLPGFGHSVYRRGDPRLGPLLDAVRAIPDPDGTIDVVDAILAEAGRTVGVLPNVDLGLGALTTAAKLPPDAPLFAIARIAGWAAHYDEELTERPVRYRGLSARTAADPLRT